MKRLSKRQVKGFVGSSPDDALSARYGVNHCDVYRLLDGRIVVDLFGSGGQEFGDEGEFDRFLRTVHEALEPEPFPDTFGVPPDDALARVRRPPAGLLALAFHEDAALRDAWWKRRWKGTRRAWRRDGVAYCLATAGILGEAVRRRVDGDWTLRNGIPVVEGRDGSLYAVLGALAKALVERDATLTALRDAMPGFFPEAFRPRGRYLFADGEIRFVEE